MPVDDYVNTLKLLQTDLDDMIFAYEIQEDEDTREVSEIQLWETYKFHPDLEQLKILDYGSWNQSHGLDLPSKFSKTFFWYCLNGHK